MEYLPADSKAELVPAKVDVMENVQSMKLRVLYILPLSCDVWKKGIKGWGPPRLKKEIDKV